MVNTSLALLGVLISAGVGALVGLAQHGGPALGRAAVAYFLG
ncbi:hypothetical protein [Williamsia sp. CHRR-6]|nr:hypothetical protein [Williamsia sp. CHRR-6]